MQTRDSLKIPNTPPLFVPSLCVTQRHSNTIICICSQWDSKTPIREDLHYIKAINHLSNTWAALKHHYTFRLCLNDQIQACLETFRSAGLRTSVLVKRALPGRNPSFYKQCCTQTIPGHFLVFWELNDGVGHSLQAGLLDFFLLETESNFTALAQTIPVHLDPNTVPGQAHLHTGACIARRTSTRTRRNWYFPLPCAVLEGYFGNKKTQHLVSWIRNICFFIIFIVSGVIPN